MIREFEPDDLAKVQDAVQLDIDMSEKTITRIIDKYNVMVYEANQEIAGCGAWTILNSTDEEKERIDIRIYTHPDFRRKGIGTRLWNEVHKRVRQMKTNQLETFYRADSGDAREFFNRRGFKRWFTLNDLTYQGPHFPALTEIDAHQYNSDYFMEYTSIINRCFYQVRKEADIEPYIIYSEDSLEDAAIKENIRSNAENIFIFTYGQDVVGVGVVEDEKEGDANAVDVVAVKPEFRRRGFGRLITQYCINHLQKRGANPVYVAVLDNNKPALNLYRQMGFQPASVYEESRLMESF